MDTTWRKSSYSGASGNNCVEVATADRVLVRDTTDRAGPTLSVHPSAWGAFVATVREAALPAQKQLREVRSAMAGLFCCPPRLIRAA
jgi:hypothetical protein